MAIRRTQELPSRQHWTLEEALLLIRELQPILCELGYHICLGGGVLNNGESEKDLDLFILPFNQHDSLAWVVISKLTETLGAPGISIRDSPDYQPGANWHYQEMRHYSYLGKRIDVFVQ